MTKKEADKAYYQANRDTIKKKTRAYALSHPDKIKLWAKQWRGKNKEKWNEAQCRWRAKNPTVFREILRRYRQKNKALRLHLQRLRDARKRNACPKWVDLKQIRKIYEMASQMNKESDVCYQVDHIWPLAGKTFSGLHVPWNLQIITAAENRKKYDHRPDSL